MLIYPPAWLHGRRQCRARVHGGHRRCEGAAVTGRAVCRLHGGASKGGSRPGRDLSAMQDGNRKRFVERRARIAAGLPVKPHGAIKGRRKWEPIELSRARASVKAELNTLMAGKVFREGDPIGPESDASRFDRLRTKALRTVEAILDLPNDKGEFTVGDDYDQAEHHKRYRMQLEAAQGIIAGAIKIDESTLKAEQREDLITLMREKLALIKIPQKGD